MSLFLRSIFVITIFSCVVSEPIIYWRYRLYKIVPKNQKEVNYMYYHMYDDVSFDFWSRLCIDCDVVVLTPPSKIWFVEDFIIWFNVTQETYIYKMEDIMKPPEKNFWDFVFGYKLIRLTIQLNIVCLIEDNKNATGIKQFSPLFVDGKYVDFLVHRHYEDELLRALDSHNAKYQTMVEDMEMWLRTFEDHIWS